MTENATGEPDVGCVGTVSNDDIVAAVRAALRDDGRDSLGGGARWSAVAERVDVSEGYLRRERIPKLTEAGRLAVVRGVDPETFRPRESVLPADHPDAAGATTDD